MAEAYANYKLFHVARPRFPRGMDRRYAARFLREARFWAREALLWRAAAAGKLRRINGRYTEG